MARRTHTGYEHDTRIPTGEGKKHDTLRARTKIRYGVVIMPVNTIAVVCSIVEILSAGEFEAAQRERK